MKRRASRFIAVLGAFIAAAILLSVSLPAAGTFPTPEQFLGFRPGADYKLARWDRIVEYMKIVANASDRVNVRELGRTDDGNPFLLVEIGAPDTLKNIERYQQYERKLYFQGGAPSTRERDEIFRRGKVVVLITCSVHANEIGATQMALELVHQLATDDSPATRKILDNVIVLLVPSANPDGQILVTDWFNKNVGTPFENGAMPYLYHRYAGHDLNRDMYMLTQRESQYLARLAWRDWFPAVWLDQHQMGLGGPRMFVMPGSDPINPNVHPLIYRWNTILGQSQAAALEAAGKTGIIHGSMFTSFWQGALAWSGWWHNQIGVLTEVASVWVAAPVNQVRAGAAKDTADEAESIAQPGSPHAAPTDVTSRGGYPRPWTGGRWTLRDIVDHEMIGTNALLETVADRRETLLRQLYEVNLQTIEQGRADPSAVLIPVETQHDPREVAHLVDRLQLTGVDVYRTETALTVSGKEYAPGTYVVPLAQPFGRYAKDLLEPQTYPVYRAQEDSQHQPPYDISAWSLGMLMGVDVVFASEPLEPTVKLSRVPSSPATTGSVDGRGSTYAFDYSGPDSAIAVNRLLKAGATVSFDEPSRVITSDAPPQTIEMLARDLGVHLSAAVNSTPDATRPVRLPRIGLYAPWTANMDEGWTRWVLERYEFPLTTIRNADIIAGKLRDRFDAVILPDQNPRELIDGYRSAAIRPEYRGGIGRDGALSLERFVREGGTLVALGAASGFAIDRLPVPVRDLKLNLRRDRHLGPGSILRLQVDTTHPIGYGMAANTVGFYTNGPFFTLPDAVRGQTATVVARYPSSDVLASGFLQGEELMAGRAAVVSVDVNPGRVVLFGIRPQHRAQTHVTFPLLFNALYLSASAARPARGVSAQASTN